MTTSTPSLSAMLLLLALPAAALEEVTFPTANPDGATIYADVYDHEGDRARGAVLLLHDIRTGAQEFAEVAPRLAAEGFDVLAADLRTGYENRTYLRTRAYVNTFDDGIPDARGALAWARERWPGEPVVLVGSGVAADFAIAMAAEDPDGIAGVVAFSPPSTLAYVDEAEVAATLTVPLFVTYATEPDEAGQAAVVSDAAPPDLLTLHVPEAGTHGVATMTAAGNPAGWEANRAAVEAFLDRVAP